MPLKEEFERTGNWLFRHRSYLPLIITIAVPAATLLEYGGAAGRELPDQAWEILCMAISLSGLLIMNTKACTP